MIRRAQAEALLKLAEALEECERNGVTLTSTDYGVDISAGATWRPDVQLTGVAVRLAIAKLYPKSEAAE
jgi:hypothetical protein